MLRISMLRAAALTAALCWFPGAAFGQYTPATVTTSPNFNSYYAQQPKENDYLTSNNEYQAPPAEAGAACDSGCWDECCCDRFGTWRDNTILSIGAEAYKSLGDSTQPPGPATDYMASAGFVGTFNTGFQLIEDSPIRGQVGASYGVYDLNGRDTSSVGSPEQQTFFTLGLSKRSDVLNDDRLAWGLVYDQFWAHQWGLFASELYTGQVRGLLGWAVNERDELGVWGAFRTTGDNSVAGISPPPVRAMNQYNVFWRHNYDFGGQTMLWLGGNDPADVGSWLLGAMGQAPLNDYVSLYGNFTLDFAHSGSGIVGSNQQEWAFGLGLAYSLGGKAWSPSVSGRQGLPLMPVANNGSMLMTN